MFDIKGLKHKIQNGEVALNGNLEQRILNDEMTEKDYEFVSKSLGVMREIEQRVSVIEYWCKIPKSISAISDLGRRKEAVETFINSIDPALKLHHMDGNMCLAILEKEDQHDTRTTTGND